MCEPEPEPKPDGDAAASRLKLALVASPEESQIVEFGRLVLTRQRGWVLLVAVASCPL